MEIKLEIEQYSPASGVRTGKVWESGFEIITEIQKNQIVISANEAGLTSLAKILLTLAQKEVPGGCHIHLDENTCLENGSQEFIIVKTT